MLPSREHILSALKDMKCSAVDGLMANELAKYLLADEDIVSAIDGYNHKYDVHPEFRGVILLVVTRERIILIRRSTKDDRLYGEYMLLQDIGSIRLADWGFSVISRFDRHMTVEFQPNDRNPTSDYYWRVVIPFFRSLMSRTLSINKFEGIESVIET